MSPKTFSVLNHVLVPKCKIIGEKELEKVLKSYSITEYQLPKIFSNDPMVKALGAEPGQVIEIERKDQTGSYKYYRIVVPKPRS